MGGRTTQLLGGCFVDKGRCLRAAIGFEDKTNEEDDDEDESKLEARHGEFDFGRSTTLFSTI